MISLGVGIFGVLLLTSLVGGAPCERAPAHAQPSDTAYRLTVTGEPDLFLPGELYTVSLQGVDVGHGLTPFIGFTIWAETEEEPPAETDASTPRPPVQALGGFQSYDAQTSLSEGCQPAVTNATAHPKTDIQVIWSAPPNGSESCIRLCARASPAGSGAVSILARKICPAPVAPASFARQPPIVEPCCACDEAKYEVVFEGLWSRNTHPRDFPPESARAHFGDVIGASHTAQYRVWQEGRIASLGLRRLADDGTTTALEKELKAESDHIRTIIKARGISWQQVAGTGISNTFAVFRVDAKHHLVSLASKLAPSPDWFVGVSALELCNSNCTWSNSAMLPLYPYDAGTDSGITYTAHGHPTTPAAPVRALRPDWPKDAKSPFFSSTNEMRPFARLKLTRLRLYEKSCDAAENDRSKESSSSSGACATYAWGQWSPCSVTCGPGRSSRQRYYVWPARAYAEACRVPLTDYRRCTGPRMHCRAVSEYEPDPAEYTGPCAITHWSSWSPCEGCGVRARTRHYVVPRAFKHCNVGFRAYTVFSQAMPCEAGPCDKPPGVNTTDAILDWFFRDETQGACRVSQWGDWAPCSARCGRGRRLRTRFYLVRDMDVQREVLNILVHKWQGRFNELRNISQPKNMTVADAEVFRAAQEHINRCQNTVNQQEAICDGEDGSCGHVRPEVCHMPMMVGHCRGYTERWFYEAARNTCEPFGYTGCGGNSNNFRDRETCIQSCKRDFSLTTTTTTKSTTSTTPPTTEALLKKLKTVKPTINNEVIQNDLPTAQEDANCETGPWLGWSECIGDCYVAFRHNYRLVLRPASGAGKICRKLVRSRPCRPATCRLNDGTTHLSSTDNPNYDED